MLGFRNHGLPQRRFTFDFALQCPGWMHSWDVIIKRCLSSLSWFPSFFEKLKAVVKLCRSNSMTSDMARDLRKNGLPAIAQMLTCISIDSIAEWRWGTLWNTCDELAKFLNTLRAHFKPALFMNTKEPGVVKKVIFVFSATSWL